MDLKEKLRKGLRIFGADNREYGTIDRYDDRYAYVGERRIPVSAFERMDQDRLYLGSEGRRYFETGNAATEGEVRVPIVEEQLRVDKQMGEVGAVEIAKDVVAEQVNVPVELRREEVTVDQVDVKDRPLAPGDTAFQEGTIRVPVRGEQAVVEKDAVVTGEVVVTREQTTEQQTVGDTVRKLRVNVDENYRKDRGAFEQHFNAHRAATGAKGKRTRTFAQAEPNYRRGYEAGYDERYAGHQRFEDVEPELRRAHTGGESWDELREEVHEGWTRARGR